MSIQSNTAALQLQTVSQTIEEQHPIALLFPLEVEELEDTWPENWSWSDDMITF